MQLALVSLWLLSPFATGALLGASERARRLACRHYSLLVACGVTGLVLVALGAFILARPLALVALAAGGPLSGLAFWVRREDGGDDWRRDDDDEEPEPPPPGDDWDRIVEQFERHVAPHTAPAVAVGGSSPEPATTPVTARV